MRKKTVFQSSAFILLLALTAIVIRNQLILQNRDKTWIRETPGVFSKPFHDISKLHYTRTENTIRMFSIQADRFRVQKKKVGLFRFGLIKEIVVDNATIDVYESSDQELNLQTMTQALNDSKTIPGLVPKSTGKLIFSPVILQILSQDGQILSRVSAESATVNGKTRQIVFNRNVEIHSGNRSLHADFLSVISKDGRVIARKGVVLKIPERIITGEVLQTDMFLTVYSDDEKGEL